MTDYFNKKEISQRAEDELLYEYVIWKRWNKSQTL